MNRTDLAKVVRSVARSCREVPAEDVEVAVDILMGSRMPRRLSTAEAARRLNISPKTLWRRIKDGRYGFTILWENKRVPWFREHEVEVAHDHGRYPADGVAYASSGAAATA